MRHARPHPRRRIRRRSKSPAIGNCGSSFCKARATTGSRSRSAAPQLAGHQRSVQFEGPVSGRLSGDLVQLSFTSRYEASTICYFLDGQIRDGVMSGTAVLGAASDQNHGIVNRSQFGTGRWEASRVA